MSKYKGITNDNPTARNAIEEFTDELAKAIILDISLELGEHTVPGHIGHYYSVEYKLAVALEQGIIQATEEARDIMSGILNIHKVPGQGVGEKRGIRR